MPDKVKQAGGEQDEDPLANTPAGVDELNLLVTPGNQRGNGLRGHSKGTNLPYTGVDAS